MSAPSDLVDLVDLVDDAVLAEAVAHRLRRRTLAGADADDGSLLGSLVRLGQLGAVVTVQTDDGAVQRGAVAAVASDHVVLTGPDDAVVVVALAAVVLVRTGSGAPAPTDSDVRVTGGSLAEALRTLGDDHTDVLLTTSTGVRCRGRVTQVGRDVVRVACVDGAVLVPLHALAHARPTA